MLCRFTLLCRNRPFRQIYPSALSVCLLGGFKEREYLCMNYFFKTLTGKIALVLLMIVLPAVLSLYLFNRQTQENWRSRQIADAEHETALYAAAMDRELSLLEETMLNLPLNNSIFDELQRTEPGDTQEYWNTATLAWRQLDAIARVYSFLENVYVYYPQTGLFMNDQRNPEMAALVRGDIDSALTDVSTWESTETASGRYLYLVYPIKSYYLGVWVSYDSLLNYICSAANTLEFPDKTLYTLSPTSEALPNIAANSSLTVTKLVPHPLLQLTRRIPVQTLKMPGHWYNGSPMVVAILLALLLIAVVLSVWYWVIVPIRDITAGIETITGGDITYRLSGRRGFSREFNQITAAFNNMMDRLENMRIRIYEQELEQQETKLRYLGQQIQPHFILNSLNTLYTYSNRDVNETRKIIKLLSGYYRYVVNVESRYVMLEQELAHLEDFLSLQKIRFPSRLNYRIRCDEESRVVPIPPFLLENFISNALKYGQDENGTIDISLNVRQTAPFVTEITVSDCGAGFSEESLDAIQAFQQSGQKSDELGIGIANCMERLSLIYQERAAIVCTNRRDADTGAILGATVVITIHVAEDDSQRSACV